MFGLRVLLYLVGIGLVVWLLVRLARGPSRPGTKRSRAVDNMVRCARCGTFVPRNEAVCEGERCYCSTEHRNLDRGRDGN